MLECHHTERQLASCRKRDFRLDLKKLNLGLWATLRLYYADRASRECATDT